MCSPDGNTVSITIPCKSLKAALSHVRMGDVLVLEGGCGDTVIVVRNAVLQGMIWPDNGAAH